MRGCQCEKRGMSLSPSRGRERKQIFFFFFFFFQEQDPTFGLASWCAETLTGDGGGVVGGVGPQVLGGLGGRLRQALRAAAVTHAGGQQENDLD